MTRPRRAVAIPLLIAAQIGACAPVGQHPLDPRRDAAPVAAADDAAAARPLLERDEPRPSFLTEERDVP